jgi:hypothetical protein
MLNSIRYLGKTAAAFVVAAGMATNIAAADSAPKMTVTFTNAMNIYIASLHVKDRGKGGTPIDVTRLSIGPQQGARYSVIKDQNGKYELEVTLQCGGQSNTRIYYDSVPTLKIEKSSDPVGCNITSAKTR